MFDIQQGQILQSVHEVRVVQWGQLVHCFHLCQQVQLVQVAPLTKESVNQLKS